MWASSLPKSCQYAWKPTHFVALLLIALLSVVQSMVPTTRVPVKGQPKRCREPGYPRGGNRTLLFAQSTVKVKYHCAEGLRIVGSEVADCLDTGLWSTPQPRCVNESIHSIARCLHSRIVSCSVNSTALSDAGTHISCTLNVSTSWLQQQSVGILSVYLLTTPQRTLLCSQDITSVEDVGDLSMLSCISSDPWNALFNLQAIAIELQRSDGETVTRKAWVTYPSINPPFRAIDAATVHTIVVAQTGTLRRHPGIISEVVRSFETKSASNGISRAGTNRYAFLPASHSIAYQSIHLTPWNRYISRLEEMELARYSTESTGSTFDPSIEDVARLADQNCTASPGLVRIVIFIHDGRPTNQIDLQDSIRKLQQCSGGVVRTIVTVMCEDYILENQIGFSAQNGVYKNCGDAGYCYPRPGRFSSHMYFSYKPYLLISLLTSGAMWNIGRGRRPGLSHLTELITDDLISSVTGSPNFVQHPSCNKFSLTGHTFPGTVSFATEILISPSPAAPMSPAASIPELDSVELSSGTGSISYDYGAGILPEEPKESDAGSESGSGSPHSILHGNDVHVARPTHAITEGIGFRPKPFMTRPTGRLAIEPSIEASTVGEEMGKVLPLTKDVKHSFAEALPRRETTTSDLLFLFFGVFGGTASAFIIWFALVKVRAAIKHRHGYDLPPVECCNEIGSLPCGENANTGGLPRGDLIDLGSPEHSMYGDQNTLSRLLSSKDHYRLPRSDRLFTNPHRRIEEKMVDRIPENLGRRSAPTVARFSSVTVQNYGKAFDILQLTNTDIFPHYQQCDMMSQALWIKPIDESDLSLHCNLFVFTTRSIRRSHLDHCRFALLKFHDEQWHEVEKLSDDNNSFIWNDTDGECHQIHCCPSAYGLYVIARSNVKCESVHAIMQRWPVTPAHLPLNSESSSSSSGVGTSAEESGSSANSSLVTGGRNHATGRKRQPPSLDETSQDLHPSPEEGKQKLMCGIYAHKYLEPGEDTWLNFEIRMWRVNPDWTKITGAEDCEQQRLEQSLLAGDTDQPLQPRQCVDDQLYSFVRQIYRAKKSDNFQIKFGIRSTDQFKFPDGDDKITIPLCEVFDLQGRGGMILGRTMCAEVCSDRNPLIFRAQLKGDKLPCGENAFSDLVKFDVHRRGREGIAVQESA